jgi:hypothetical protein
MARAGQLLERANDTATSQVFITQHVLYRDYETRSRLDLRKVGAHKYAAVRAPKSFAAPMR